MISTSTDVAIRAEGLHRTFNETVAVAGLSFAVERGEVFGFLGPNGAGKTTTIRMLTGQLAPTSGTARVAGCDVVSQRKMLKPRIGIVFEFQNLYDRMSAYENMSFFARLYKVPPARVLAMLAQVHLQDRHREIVGRYSNGMKQRLLIARALLHEPQVLFLDEPTRGLDPAVARGLRTLIAELAQRGMTIFLTTHYMEEADQLCNRVAIIDQGRIVALDTPARLKRQASSEQSRVKVTLRDEQQITLRLEVSADRHLLTELIQSEKVLGLHSQEATLEEVFIQLTGRKLAQ